MSTISPAHLERQVTGKKVLIDTNIVIYLTDKVEPYEDLSKLLLCLYKKLEIIL